MKNKESIPLPTSSYFSAPLVDESKPWCVIRFNHTSQGETKAHVFYSVVNKLTGDRFSAYDSTVPGINDPLSWVRRVLRDTLANKANSNIEIAGTIKPAPPIKE